MRQNNEQPLKALIISPESWGTMRISKHHYSIELAKNGYDVFFLDPLISDWKIRQRRFEVTPSEIRGLNLVSHKTAFPYNIKFHFSWLYEFFVSRHIQFLERTLGPFDIVWSYDINNSIPLRYFSQKSKKFFFAADWPKSNSFINACQSASLIASVAQEILDLYLPYSKAKHLLLQHGVANCFLETSKLPFQPSSNRIKVGISGNLLRPDINRPVLTEIVHSHQDVDFEFFGPSGPNQSNLGCEFDSPTEFFIDTLRKNKNVKLHGVVSPEKLAHEYRGMDAFLICYDESLDQSKATNYHKVSEFLAYQRPIIANRISAHVGNPLVIQTAGANGVVNVAENFRKFIKTYKREIVFENGFETQSYANNLEKILSVLK